MALSFAAFAMTGRALASSQKPCDSNATLETRELMKILADVSVSSSFIFGHHNTNYMGQHWSDPDCSMKRSDVKEAVGQFPGIFEYNFAWVSEGHRNLVPHVKHAISVGAVVELHWEPSNPVTGGTVKDTSGDAIRQILPGGSAHAKWTGWLDDIAEFAHEVNHPMVFRLFHENTGGWFWWGTSAAEPADFRKAFQFTIDYLRNTRGVHNLLVAYSPSTPSQHQGAFSEDSKSMYPGDNYVDVACFDRYGTDDFHEELLKDCEEVVNFAEKHGKIPAICETGARSGSQTLNPMAARTWWNASVLDPIKQSSCSKIAWALTWFNNNPSSYWVPLPGETSYESFTSFHADEATLFAGDFSTPWNTQLMVV